mgnify:CR=1 FL=1
MQHLIHNTIQYNLATPVDFDPTKKYPLIIYLHGAGGRGHDLELPRYPYMMEEYIHKNDIPAMVAGPLCEYDNWFMCFSELIGFVRFASTMDNVDPDRVYLMGSSMGGYATWAMLMSTPELFAAAVPICGGGMAWNAYRMKDIPIWAFHGREDDDVSVNETLMMAAALERTNSAFRCTIYDGVGHNCWSLAMDKTRLQWLLEQHK